MVTQFSIYLKLSVAARKIILNKHNQESNEHHNLMKMKMVSIESKYSNIQINK